MVKLNNEVQAAFKGTSQAVSHATKTQQGKNAESVEDKQRRQEWLLEGITVFGFPQENLQKVIEKLARAGFVPVGYNYAELHQLKHTPQELEQALARKLKHEANKNK